MLDDDDDLEAEIPLGDGTVDTAARVHCPYCREAVEILVDPAGGASQEYVEDCQICCQPWRVSVHYDEEGRVAVTVNALEE